jgi:hypothetical protein
MQKHFDAVMWSLHHTGDNACNVFGLTHIWISMAAARSDAWLEVCQNSTDSISKGGQEKSGSMKHFL